MTEIQTNRGGNSDWRLIILRNIDQLCILHQRKIG